ncbi:Interferon-induced GTP-binding protein Mx [Cladobotryum mycophilum]|uniref:Interferon-induced GTP-binding protein Mx n=1 Tax=Cladobotryum mycophilum TaxID=491253 RepID=A0ABR0SRI3_9HYPO
MTTNEISLDAEALGQLGHEQRALLDTIDSLRNLGVELESLPQIVVVGDKSSGKSSVLEAISRVCFPVKSGLCTRSPTELVLRKAPHQRFAVKIPGRNPDRPLFDEKQFTREDLPRIIDEAKELLGIGDGARDFSEEVLRIEISGPDLPHLTLVDLPGLYHAETKDESSEGMATVNRLAERYMKQKNTIILAVISAQSDMSLQAVLRRAKKHDPLRERTLGVITKPDKLESGSSEEATYFQLAQNQEPSHTLKLGWHILRNRDGKENGEGSAGASRISDQDRDENERAFLNSSLWENIPSHNKGVEALRQKLSGILTKHIQQSLPGLIDDIESKLSNRQNRLTQLGEARKSDSERRGYLLQIANRFRDTARAATKGTYDGKFFSTLSHDNVAGQLQVDSRKLRAVIRNLNCAFDAVLSTNGATRKIQWDNNRLIEEGNEYNVPSSLQAWIDVFRAEEPEDITWSDLKEELEMRAANNQGTQFPGSPNDRLALELFRHQSQRWGNIAERYLDLVLKAARSFVQLALEYIVGANASTRDAIIDEYVDDFFRERAADLQVRLDELLVHYQDGDAICLEDDFQRRVAKRNKLHLALRVRDILQPHEPSTLQEALDVDTVFNAIKNAPEENTDNFGLERVAEMMTAYYEMSLRTFTDNVIILAAENCLISKIPELLTSMTAYDIDEERLKRLADEPQIVGRERVRLTKEIQALKAGLRICEKHRPWGITPFPTVVMRSEASNRGQDQNGLGIAAPGRSTATYESERPKSTLGTNEDGDSKADTAPGTGLLSSSPTQLPSNGSFTNSTSKSGGGFFGTASNGPPSVSKTDRSTPGLDPTRRSSGHFSFNNFGISPAAATRANSTSLFGSATIQSPLTPSKEPRESKNDKLEEVNTDDLLSDDLKKAPNWDWEPENRDFRTDKVNSFFGKAEYEQFVNICFDKGLKSFSQEELMLRYKLDQDQKAVST